VSLDFFIVNIFTLILLEFLLLAGGIRADDWFLFFLLPDSSFYSEKGREKYSQQKYDEQDIKERGFKKSEEQGETIFPGQK